MKHESRFRVRYAETDQMGVVYYANYLVWMEVGRSDLVRSLDCIIKNSNTPKVCICRSSRRTAAICTQPATTRKLASRRASARLTTASSKFPIAFVHSIPSGCWPKETPGTSGSTANGVPRACRRNTATNCVYHESERMIHVILPVGLLQCNCSIFGDETTREAIVVDPGDDVSDITAVLDQHRLKSEGHRDYARAYRSRRRSRAFARAFRRAGLPE